MGMGMGMGMGMPGQPADVSLTQRMESGTQATFELISSIVGAFGGFAQMLESTFMATHSSFFAMVGVADQFAHLRNYLGQVLSIFALARYLKNLFLRMTGRAPAIDLDPREFKEFAKAGGSAASAGGQGAKARPSKRPLIVFFLAVVGLPYLMGKLVRLITARQEEERLRLEQQGLLPPGSQNMTPQQQQQHIQQQQMLQQQQQAAVGGAQTEALDPSKLTFVRAMYAYNASDPLELSLKSNDIVAVLSKVDPSTGQESQWWKGRTRDGRVGWFPSTYVESLESAKERASKSSVAGPSETKSVESAAPQKALPKPAAASTTR
jgi:peroxin-13